MTIAKIIFRFFFLYCGPWTLFKRYKKWRVGCGITILYGHRVLPDKIIADQSDPRTITGHTSVSEVEYGIKLLKKNYKIISIDDAITQLKNNAVEDESIVLTFDDGFKDNFDYLFPLLKKYNIPAVFYVNASVIGTKKSLWFQAVINYFYSVDKDEVYIDMNNKLYDLRSPQKRYLAAFDFMQFLQNNIEPNLFLESIEKVAGELCNPLEQDYHMNWEDLKTLAAEPLITIGAHSLNHYPLGYCDKKLSEVEIGQSIEILESKLNIKIEHFSYPRGHSTDFNEHHKAYLNEIGISSSVSTVRGVNRSGDPLYSLKRVGFPQNISKNIEDFLWHVAGIPQIIQNLFSKGNEKN